MIMLCLLVIFILFLVTISMLKSNGLGNGFFSLFSNIPHHDKIGHFVLMGTLAFLLLHILYPLFIRKFSHSKSLVIVATLLSIVIGLEEASQSFLSNRSCTWSDFFGLIGILVATALYHFISDQSRYRTKVETP